MRKTCIFWQSLIFCKKRRNTNEKRMIFLKSPVFFWSPCQISCLEKVWIIQKGAQTNPDWPVFELFWMIQHFYKKCSNKTCAFSHWKWKSKALSSLPRKPQVKIKFRSWFMARGIRVLFSTSVEHISSFSLPRHKKLWISGLTIS